MLTGDSKCPQPKANPEDVNTWANCLPLAMGFNLETFDSPDKCHGNVTGARLELSVLDKENLYKGPDQACGNHLIWSAPLQPASQDFLWYEFLMHVHWMKCNEYSFNEPHVGACLDKPDSKKGAFTELWIRRVLPFTSIPVEPFSYVQKDTHYNDDGDWCDEDDCKFGELFMKQGLYHCHQDIHLNCNITKTESIYHDGMEYLKCTDNFPAHYKRLLCDSI
jgi:hypothetical protein